MKLNWIIILVFVGLSFIMGRYGFREEIEITKYDTIETIKFDTIRDTLLIPTMVTKIGYDTTYLTSLDTIKLHDTIKVDLPIEQKIYQTDFYKATIKGYQSELVVMEIYQQTKYVDRYIEKTIKQNNKFSVGPSVGVTYLDGKISPYLGIGIQYNLFNF